MERDEVPLSGMQTLALGGISAESMRSKEMASLILLWSAGLYDCSYEPLVEKLPKEIKSDLRVLNPSMTFSEVLARLSSICGLTQPLKMYNWD